MAISEKSRSALYQGLAPITGEDAVGEMLSYFPARDVEEPVTKEFLRAEIADVHVEFGRVHAEFGKVHAEFGNVRAEFGNVRAEIADVRTEIAELRGEMHERLSRMLLWLMGTIVGTASIAVTVVVAVLLKVAG